MDFSVGSVMRRSLAVLARNAGKFGVVALVFTLPSVVYSQMLSTELSGIAGSPAGPAPVVERSDTSGTRIIAFMFVGGMIMFLLQALAAAMLSYGTIRDLRGGTVTLSECLSGSLPAAFRVLGITVLLGLLIVLASMVAAIPGGILAALGMRFFGTILLAAPVVAVAMIITRYWLAIPAAVVEGTGVIASLARSSALAKGHGWRVFGLVALLYGMSFGVAWIIGLVAGSANPTAPSLPAAIPGIVVAAFFLAWQSVAAAVAYHDLRIALEGRPGDDVATVFE